MRFAAFLAYFCAVLRFSDPLMSYKEQFQIITVCQICWPSCNKTAIYVSLWFWVHFNKLVHMIISW